MTTKDGVLLSVMAIAAILGTIAMVKYDFRHATVSDLKTINKERLDRIETKLDQLLNRGK